MGKDQNFLSATSLRSWLNLCASLIDAIPLSLELGAEIAETSPRTLRRRLAHEGTSWRRILDRVRFEACERRMLESSLTLTEIAGELGYSDQAHFTRAFYRWTGEALELLPPS